MHLFWDDAKGNATGDCGFRGTEACRLIRRCDPAPGAFGGKGWIKLDRSILLCNYCAQCKREHTLVESFEACLVLKDIADSTGKQSGPEAIGKNSVPRVIGYYHILSAIFMSETKKEMGGDGTNGTDWLGYQGRK